MKRFFVTAKTGTPLLELLSNNLPEKFNPEVVITSGGVWKDKKRITDPAVFIGAGETVKVHISSFQGKTFTLEKEQVVFENPDLLVVYKPCNLNVHAVPTSMHYHLAHGVDRYLRRQGIAFEATPLTRLDRAVEGLVLFARNKPAERRLFKLVKNRKIHKWYTAALHKNKNGENPRCLRIRDTISNNGSRTLADPGGKTADSLFIKTHSLESADIYSVFIFTGRRHQIRFHAAHYIAPIIGDTDYDTSGPNRPPDEIALMCRGYNIPDFKQNLRIRAPQSFLERFYGRLGNHGTHRKHGKIEK
ncbi:MAG: RNA pseudouridine synthase [bacterium]|nr:RNA pseudouridine synthase [bacterium]